jgi:ADP-ribose pyrophosphatase YjhB (NUDIX family)
VSIHCRACGAPLAPGRPAICERCGRHDWGNAKPCAAALVVRDGLVLLTRRAQPPWQGLWCAPSGFCDGGEHPIETAERELREEAGLEGRVVGYLGTWVTPYADDPAVADEHVSVQYYAALARTPGDGLADPAEVSELGWFPIGSPPLDVAPADVLPVALAALQAALAGPGIETPLPDRPTTP